MIASLILATLNATFLLAVLAIAIDMRFDHHFITDLVFEAFTITTITIYYYGLLRSYIN